jgi:predicted  nucleic acid-binding Zn-ribbon protein
MNPHELKELQVRLTKAQAEAETAQGELGRAQQKYRDAVQLVEQLRSRLTNASQKPVVSEHALLRYIERFHGINLEEIRAKILTERNVAAIARLGTGKYPIEGGGRAVVKGNTVVSVVED